MSTQSKPPRRILFATIAIALLAGWVMLRAYTYPATTDCDEGYQAARTAADTARVDSLVPKSRTGTRATCGFRRTATRLGDAEYVSRDSSIVRRIVEGLIWADNGSDLVSVLGYYGDSAVLVPPDEPPVAGIRAIRARYEQFFSDFKPAIEGRIDSMVVRDSTAMVWGHTGGWLRAIAAGMSDRALDDDYRMTLEIHRGAWQIARLEWQRATSPP